MSRFLVALALTGCVFAAAPTPKPAGDPLGRENPRSSVTGFIEACHQQDYTKASQYLDLSQFSPSERSRQGPQLAKDLESVLNADKAFDPITISQRPEGPPDGLETIASIRVDEQSFALQLKFEPQKSGPAIWLFSPQTVALLPKITPVPSTESVIAARLPRVFVATEIAGTSLWKWIALLLAALIILGLFRLIASFGLKLFPAARWRGVHAWLEPALLFVSAGVFRAFEELLGPSLFSRVYINGFLLLVVVGAVAWGVLNLVELFLTRLDAVFDPRQRAVSRSLIYLARRTARVVVFVVATIFALNQWGLHMTAIITGLGVGGIAVALAAQQTIANVFGGVSVIGDHPIMVGDFGNFGGVIGYVDDIGLRSTRIRTLSRTLVSIPNSSFAGMNLENYSVRDKMLFNPTLSMKRATPQPQIEKAILGIERMLREDHRLQTVPATARITALTSTAFTVEVFCYVRTSDADEFYKIASDLYLKIDEQLTTAGVELA